MREWLCKVLRCDKHIKKQIGFGWRIGQPQPKTKVSMQEITITNEQKILMTVKPVTATGKPAKLDGPIAVTATSGESTFEIQPDGNSFYLISADTPGDSQFLVEGDADLGSGVETISDTVKLTVEGAKAANLGLTSGTPEPKA